jgi:hypothetical protein
MINNHIIRNLLLPFYKISSNPPITLNPSTAFSSLAGINFFQKFSGNLNFCNIEISDDGLNERNQHHSELSRILLSDSLASFIDKKPN